MRNAAALRGRGLRGFHLLAGLLHALLSASLSAAPIPEPTRPHYPGVIRLEVDATDIERKILRVKETIPASPGRLTLLFPQWLPGNHSPHGRVDGLSGLVIQANGKPLAWTRDTVNMHAFHVEVPAGVAAIDAEFQYLTANTSQHGRVLITPDIVNLQWNSTLLYPAGVNAAGITLQAGMHYPAAWKFATALETARASEGYAEFKATNLVDLIDSPVYIGRHLRSFELADAKTPVRLNVVADDADNLEAQPEHVDVHRRLVQQAYRLFGAPPYAHYDFLIATSELFGGTGGLEHRQSTEIGVRAGYFAKWKTSPASRGVVAHEYVHVWDGKFRRPVDLATRNYNEPMQNSLLWVYEGQTSYWGNVLAARSGLHSPTESRAMFANTVAGMVGRAGRDWRSLQDVTNDPIILPRGERAWPSWQRGADYYPEGAMLWLETDLKIRELTGDQRSLDDFARAFYAVPVGKFDTVTYTFEDVVKTLNAVAPFDWRAFLRKRLDAVRADNPLDALGKSGWRLVFTDKPSEFEESLHRNRNQTSFAHSLGITIGRQDAVAAVEWGSPAFAAKVSVGATLVAVNGRAYKQELLVNAIKAGASGKPIELLLKADDTYRTVSIDYRGGLRYPQLERVEGTPDRLSAILAPRP